MMAKKVMALSLDNNPRNRQKAPGKCQIDFLDLKATKAKYRANILPRKAKISSLPLIFATTSV